MGGGEPPPHRDNASSHSSTTTNQTSSEASNRPVPVILRISPANDGKMAGYIHLAYGEIIDYTEGVHDRVDILHVIDTVGDRRDPKIISGAHLGHGCLFVVIGDASLRDLLPKVDDEKVWEKSPPNWVSEILQVPGIGQMLRRKWSHVSVLQKLVHGRRCLHVREELEITQTNVDTAEFAHLVRRVANKADWFSS